MQERLQLRQPYRQLPQPHRENRGPKDGNSNGSTPPNRPVENSDDSPTIPWLSRFISSSYCETTC